ncbi:MAG: hypothetical protein J0J06_00175 [Sphingomonas sp.]|uniref:hypothetical protein n=1 Tax=Sphingomonas sp. TaxID=28214 RepID=UPI001AC5857B|nr:hypothetical protein [Sphingomonas sp.]MBN8813845.1 hypothetical protein [Sphingomonas sp.]
MTPFASLFDHRTKVALPIATVAGVVVAGLVAIAFLIMPIAVIENMAVDSGIASILTAAAPPLGLTARLAVAFFAALVAGGLTWFGLFLILGARSMLLRRGESADGVPVLRRADAHPDAPPRRPVFANSDLGTPFLDVKADPIEVAAEFEIVSARTVPADLDTPIAEYWTPSDAPLPDADPEPVFVPIVLPEPEAIVPPVEEPAPAPVLTPVSAPRFAPHERIETFGLTPPSPDDETTRPLPQATIHDLLERLERGVAKRQPESEAPREQTLEETLDALRALARRVG